MALPNPDDYKDWREYARVLSQALADDREDVSISIATQGGGSPGEFMPDGYVPVWLNEAEANLYLGNPAYDPPDAADLFRIDTEQLADAAVEIQKIKDGAVGPNKLMDLAVVTAKIGDAAILTAKIGELQVVTGKISDLAVNNAKIADLAVSSAKIANLAVGVAHIQDAAITNAKIANEISSFSWNETTKTGWALKKDGSIEGRNITIYNPDGSIAFGSGSKINLATQIVGLLASSNISGLGTLATLNLITPSNTSGFGALSLANSVDLGSQTTGNLPIARTVGFGSLAAINMLTAGNISTYIEGAAIVRALIANAAIGTAQIDNAAISTALIQDAAISNAKIGDAQITSAKIGDAQITTAKIGDGQITSAKIGDAEITSAKIGALQVQTANIADLTVGTEQIKGSAVTQYVSISGLEGEFSGSAQFANTAAVAINSLGGLIRVDVSLDFVAANGTNARYSVYLRRNGQAVSRQININQINTTTNKAPLFFFETEAPGAGLQSYDLMFQQTSGSNGSLSWSAVKIFVQEYKK